MGEIALQVSVVCDSQQRFHNPECTAGILISHLSRVRFIEARIVEMPESLTLYLNLSCSAVSPRVPVPSQDLMPLNSSRPEDRTCLNTGCRMSSLFLVLLLPLVLLLSLGALVAVLLVLSVHLLQSVCLSSLCNEICLNKVSWNSFSFTLNCHIYVGTIFSYQENQCLVRNTVRGKGPPLTRDL